ncbi:uncharacterized protein TNCV_1229291 [Trichonephila clavipes]|nr:uncharacterized protein TNCV_1229291 [Trichonephila clavipes]
MLIYELPSSSLRCRANPNVFRRSFEPFDQMLYHRMVLEPHTAYPIPAGTRYILLTVQKTMFRVDIIPERILPQLMENGFHLGDFRQRKRFDQKTYKLPPPTPAHVPAETHKRPLEQQPKPLSKKKRVIITPIIRPFVPSVRIIKPSTALSTPQTVSIPDPSPEQTTPQIPDPPVVETTSQILLPDPPVIETTSQILLPDPPLPTTSQILLPDPPEQTTSQILPDPLSNQTTPRILLPDRTGHRMKGETVEKVPEEFNIKYRNESENSIVRCSTEGELLLGSMRVFVFIPVRLHPPWSPTREAARRSSDMRQARHLPQRWYWSIVVQVRDVIRQFTQGTLTAILTLKQPSLVFQKNPLEAAELITSRLTGAGYTPPPVYGEAWAKGHATGTPDSTFPRYGSPHTANMRVRLKNQS